MNKSILAARSLTARRRIQDAATALAVQVQTPQVQQYIDRLHAANAKDPAVRALQEMDAVAGLLEILSGIVPASDVSADMPPLPSAESDLEPPDTPVTDHDAAALVSDEETEDASDTPTSSKKSASKKSAPARK